MKSVHVFGAQGMLGRAVLRRLGCAEPLCLDPFAAVTVRDGSVARIENVDLTDADAVTEDLAAAEADCVINCAAMTDVDGAEAKQEPAYAINRDAAGYIARAAASVGARVIHISTDFVFDGAKDSPYTVDDAPHPQSVYAQSKYEGELAVAGGCDGYAIVRTAWLYGHGKRNFVERVLEFAADKPRLMGVMDETGSPTYADDLAEMLVLLTRSDARGLFHCTNSGFCSRLDWIKAILELANIDKPVDPVPASTFKLPAARPGRCVLDCSMIEAAVGRRMRPWREALADYFRKRSD